ncbi:hypothetical protein K1T71_013282 [Dendrolimus kikuchii]|uniref:Uncharacterized protein n=1 Tax=Dendrolimus kikuchii TaxID=765133 RepID=A0ACC1CHK6_9NEOP|nr:hypothetical protein K1T71_013282 [Dendrolimus kikuchii]
MKEFRYDIVKLLQSVGERPCLWDKTLDCYKDRFERKTAWEEIFNLLDERYPDMNPEEKRETGEHIMGKWQNTRDTFIRSLRIGRNGRLPKRKYMLHEHIKFLTKVAPDSCNIDFANDDSLDSEPKRRRRRRQEDDESVTYNEESKPFEYYVENVEEKSNDFNNSSDNEVYVRPKKKFKKETSTSVKEIESNSDLNFVEVEETNNPRLMNEDEAFFASLLPSVVRYNEDERLEFRIEVLKVMNRIREKQRTYELSQ